MSVATTWTPADCAAFLQVTPERLRQLRKRGGGPPFIKVGRDVRYVPAEVGRWIQSTQRTTTHMEHAAVGVIV